MLEAMYRRVRTNVSGARVSLGSDSCAWLTALDARISDPDRGKRLQDEVLATIRQVLPAGWSLDVEEVRRGGARAIYALVTTEEDRTERRAGEIVDLIARAALPVEVERVALFRHAL